MPFIALARVTARRARCFSPCRSVSVAHVGRQWRRALANSKFWRKQLVLLPSVKDRRIMIPAPAFHGRHRAVTLGMTLVEVLIGMAIASLMTPTGWRAIVHCRRLATESRPTPHGGGNSMTGFVTLEADLRRASLADFSGSESSMSLLQPAIDGGPVTTVAIE